MLPDSRIRQRDYLLEIARAITQELNLDKLLTHILKVAAEMLAGQTGLIAMRGEDGGWTVKAAHGIPSSFLRYLDPLLSEVSDNEDPTRFELPEINRILQNLTRAASLGLLTGVGLPLIVRQKVIGLIFIFRNYAGRFSANDRALLQSFADQAAIAVQNAQLYTQVSIEKQRLDALLDSAADGVLIFAPDHLIERSNIAFSKMYGEAPEKIRGKRHEEIVRWAQNPRGITLEDAEIGGWPLGSNASLYVEGDLERPNLPPLPVGVTYAPLFSSTGTLVNIIATVRDITHFREAEELKSTFISVISHELKTPVALIKGYVGTLRRKDASWDPEIIQNSLEVIEDEADRLTELIENLLDASRLQAGGLSLNLSDVSLKVISERLAKRFETQSDAHQFVIQFPEDYPVVLADENRIGQVISNLLSNAIKYAPDGGVIVLKGIVHQEQLIICVHDQGPGFAPEDIPYVFDRFYRSKIASRTTKGAGLGLFLARAVVEAHGGRIWVEQKPGDGARICFSLPR